MKKLKKQLLIVLSVLCCVVLAIGLTACGETETSTNGKSAIELWLELPENAGKTSADFWKELKGEKGDKGDSGEKGDQGETGKDGKSAYEVWKGLEGNADKTEAEFIEALKGAAGIDGKDGADGKDGVGIEKIELNGEGTKFIITLTNGTVLNVNIPAVSNTCEHKYDSWVLQEHGEDPDTIDATLKVCTKCGASVLVKADGHVWGEEVTTVPATCTTDGYDARLCEICGEADTKTNVVKALGHDWEEIILIEEGKQVCEVDYFTGNRCKVCAVVDEESLVAHEADAHAVAEGTWKLDVKPTLSTLKDDKEDGKKGSIKGYCATCNKEIVEEIPAVTAEDYDIDGDIDACGASREIEVTYKALDYITFTVTVPAKSHTFKLADGEKHEVSSDAVTITEADITAAAGEKPAIRLFDNVVKTCADTGMSAYTTCADCGDDLLITVKFEHAPKADDAAGIAAAAEKHYTACGVAGKTGEFTCRYCNQKVTIALPALDHEYGYKVEANPVVAGGKQTFKVTKICERNKEAGYDYDCSDSVDVDAAAEGKLIDEKDAECDAEGYKKYKLTITIDTTSVEKEITVKLNKTAHYVMDGDEKVEIKEGAEINYDEFVKEHGEDLIKLFNNIKPTCTTPAYGRYVCAHCGNTNAVTLIRAHLKPTDESLITTTPATCTKPAKITYTCQYADHNAAVTEEIGEALGHDPKYTYGEGSKKLVVTCNREDCSYSNTIDVIDTKTTDATCTEAATITYIGENGATVVQKVGNPVHSLKDADGKFVLAPEKDKDGNNILYTIDDKQVFTFGNVRPACSSVEGTDGYYTCAKCGASILVKVKADHKKIAGTETTTKEATCTEDGEMTYKCSTCDPENNTVKVTINKKGHDLSYKVDVAENGDVVVTETCGRTGCTLGEKKTTRGKLENTEIFTKNEKESKASTCKLAGKDVYDFEFTNENGKKVALQVVVELEAADHDQAGPVSWKKDGKIYHGYYCKDCHQYLIEEVEEADTVA